MGTTNKKRKTVYVKTKVDTSFGWCDDSEPISPDEYIKRVFGSEEKLKEFEDELCCTILADRMMANGVHSDCEIMVKKGATKTHRPYIRPKFW